MENPKTPAKMPLPFSVNKRQLVEMYIGQIPEQTIISNINTIILDNRKKLSSYKGKSDRQIIGTQKVWHQEFCEIIEIYGMPKGYYKPENY